MLPSKTVFFFIVFILKLFVIVVSANDEAEPEGEEGHEVNRAAIDSIGGKNDEAISGSEGMGGKGRVTRLTFDGADGSARICSQFNDGSCFPGGATDCDRVEFIRRMDFLASR